MKKLLTILMIIGFLFTNAQEFSNLSLLGHWGSYGPCTALDYNENYLYLVNSTASVSKFLIMDVSDLMKPIVVNHFTMNISISDIQVVGEYAYVASKWDGLIIINISDPLDLKIEGKYGIYAEELFIAEDYAYICSGEYLKVIDISNPALPVEKGYFQDDFKFTDVYVENNTAFLTSIYSGLRIVDVSDPLSLQQIGIINLPGHSLSLAIDDNSAYVATRGEGLRIIDITDQANPVELSYIDKYKNAFGVTISENYAYVGFGEDGLKIIDVRNPADPVILGSYDQFATKSIISGDNVFVNANDFGLRIIDVSDPYTPFELGNYDTPGIPKGIDIVGEHAFITCRGAGLRIVDVSDPYDPVEISFFYSGRNRPTDVKVIGNYAYELFYKVGLAIIDISDLNAPVETSFLKINYANNFDIENNIAYVSTFSSLEIIDVNDPSNPEIINTYYTGRYLFSDFVVESGFVYQTYIRLHGAGLQIFDVNDPNSIVKLGNLDTDYVRSVSLQLTINDGYVYISENFYPSDDGGGIMVVDVSDPNTPFEVSYYDSPNLHEISISNNFAYVEFIDYQEGSSVVQGIKLIDISNPANLTKAGSYIINSGYYISGIASYNEYAYLLNREGGMYIFGNDLLVGNSDYSLPNNDIQHRLYPNPFSTSTTIEYTLNSPQTVNITFYNQLGKQVDKIEQKQSAGTQQVVWATELPGGVYYIRLEAGEQMASGKVVLMR